MKCKTIPKEFEYRIYNPKNIFDLYNFIPYEIIKHHKLQMMLPTKQGLVNLYEGNYIVKDDTEVFVLTEESFNKLYEVIKIKNKIKEDLKDE